MTDKKILCAEAQMMIRIPVSKVFDALIDPEITKNFWFTKGSGKLERGKKVKWEWEMYNVSAIVTPKEILKDRKIVFEWGDEPKTVEFEFLPQDSNSTFVKIKEYGYHQTGDELIEAIKGSTGGFTTVLDGLKAWLEHGINLNLVRDKLPGGKD